MGGHSMHVNIPLAGWAHTCAKHNMPKQFWARAFKACSAIVVQNLLLRVCLSRRDNLCLMCLEVMSPTNFWKVAGLIRLQTCWCASHTKCPISWIAIEPFQICRKYRRPLRSALSCDISWKLTLPVPKRTPGPQEQPSSSSTSDPPKRCATSVKICNLVNLIGHYKVQSTDSVVTNM